MFSSRMAAVLGVGLLANIACATPLDRRGLLENKLESIVSDVLHIKPTASPTTEPDATKALSDALSSPTPSSLVDSAKSLLKAGFEPLEKLADIVDVNKTYTTGGNSMDNKTPDLPKDTKIYPKVADGDAPYSLSEDVLRKAIYIPEGFTNGTKPPLLMIPGTGQPSYMTYSPNLIPVLEKVDWADPVWLNIPGFLLGDAQLSAEYIAYAIHYISALTGKNVSLIAYSQGNIITQWALTFWPSTREHVSDFLAMSAAFRGSALVDAGCVPIKDILGCPPAIHQQRLDSNFVKAMRGHGGDSALVPTTVIYSATDEIAQPQTGANATALLKDENKVGVTHVLVQDACKGNIASGGLVSHEGIMYHPLTLAMLKDAMANDGPGNLSRVNAGDLCERLVAEGMELNALVKTEAGVSKAGLSFLQYRPYLEKEPDVVSYASISN